MKQRQDLSEKPYYRCMICPDFRTMCGGMPTRGLDTKDWCECIRDVMDFFGLSCAYVAKESGVSLRTIERVHAVKMDQDIMRSVCRQIEIVVLGHATRLLCKMDHDAAATAALIEQLRKENEHLLKENTRYAKFIDKYLDG
ncbi:MAG: hypothetical protein IKW20_05685 [Bacteroidales bacterium]|nr:hypothetical protein [Bacteroidales bacterium]